MYEKKKRWTCFKNKTAENIRPRILFSSFLIFFLAASQQHNRGERKLISQPWFRVGLAQAFFGGHENAVKGKVKSFIAINSTPAEPETTTRLNQAIVIKFLRNKNSKHQTSLVFTYICSAMKEGERKLTLISDSCGGSPQALFLVAIKM